MKTKPIVLSTKPDYDQCVDRIEAWFQHDIIDRVPIRFHRHNAEYDSSVSSNHSSLRDKWFDAEYQAEQYLRSIKGMRFNAETFPIYTPNVGPNAYAAFHGGEMTFEETTSWYHDIIHDYNTDLSKINFSKENVFYKKLMELTHVALQKCENTFLVGYPDLHPGLDCALAWRGTNDLCMDLMIDTTNAQILFDKAKEHFLEVYDDFDNVLKAHGMPSSTWMNIPVPNGRMHIPSADFSFMISPDDFIQYGLPILRDEVKTMTHNVFHVDGKGVANHIDAILSVEGVNCIQWVQGMADDYPIMQHLPFIKYVQSKGTSIIVDLDIKDLDQFMTSVSPKGIFLWIATENEEQETSIIKKLLKWK
jgi:hypothetical protein